MQHAPLYRLADHAAALKVAFRRADVDVIKEKTRQSAADKQLLELTAAYKKQLEQSYGLEWATDSPKWQHINGKVIGKQAEHAIGLQQSRIALAKKTGAVDPSMEDDEMVEPRGAIQLAEAEEVAVVPVASVL